MRYLWLYFASDVGGVDMSGNYKKQTCNAVFGHLEVPETETKQRSFMA
jgi:hypothetical protein